MINASLWNKVLAAGTAAAILATASSAANAAPIGVGQLVLKEAAAGDVTPVSWRGRRNTAIALGALGGLWLGGALARGYYGAPYGYGYYAAPPPPPRRCWQQLGPYRGQGRWVYC
jgi:hypothetical protein